LYQHCKEHPEFFKTFLETIDLDHLSNRLLKSAFSWAVGTRNKKIVRELAPLIKKRIKKRKLNPDFLYDELQKFTIAAQIADLYYLEPNPQT
jgi:hypothetical protein